MYSAIVAAAVVLFDLVAMLASGEGVPLDMICLLGIGFVLLTLFIWIAYIIGSVLLNAELNILRWMLK